ncbi:MAG: nucleotidyltransferase family protein [Clostridium sp.]|nr:nucleotidyltransferase family protein [Clostridium sp.]
MKTAVITAEYNPFHKGHRWQLEQVRAAGASHVAVVMSPDFTQRGTPAIFPKRLRAQAALQNGADLVLELPVCYALAGAQRFAFGAVQLAAAMGCVDLLAFGAEDADLVQLRQACTALQQEEVNQTIRQLLPSGITFAKARERAVAAVYGEETALLLQKPNNILAIEYLCQLEKLPDAHIQPLALGRIGNTHDGEPVGEFASASFLRGLMLEGRWEQAQQYLPQNVWQLYRQAQQDGQFADLQLGERAVLSALRRMEQKEMAQLADLSEGLENRLYRASREACSLEQLYAAVKSKRYPLARVRRLVMNAFLQLPAQMQMLPPPYLRVLGMNERGKQILSAMKRTASLPVSTSLMKLARSTQAARQWAQVEAAACDQYSIFCQQIQASGSDWSLPFVSLLGKERE